MVVIILLFITFAEIASQLHFESRNVFLIQEIKVYMYTSNANKHVNQQFTCLAFKDSRFVFKQLLKTVIHS